MSSSRLLLLGLSLLGLISSTVHAGTTGKIAGEVTDKDSGLPMPAANIVIIGTTMGAASTEDGRFFINHVPAGTYSVQATVIGYKPLLIQDVLVSPDYTTDLDFPLEPSVAITVETVEVKSERPLIQRDATSSVRIVDAEQYENLPTRGYQDAVALQAGVVGSQLSTAAEVQGNESTNNGVLFIRGGRANEVAYFVDGFSQQDPLTGYSTTAINNNAVEQIVVLNGGFNAEYGRIMSGAVNVVTKEGGDQYFGTVEVLTDNLGGDWIGTKTYDYNIYDVSLGGPLVPGWKDLSFFASGERRWQGDRSPRSYDTSFVPDGVSAELTDGIQPNNDLGGYTWQGRVNWRVNPGLSVKAGLLGSADDWREYLHTYAFNQEHMPRYEDRNNSFFGTVTQNMGSNSFLDLKVNYFATERKRGDGVAFDDLDAYIRYIKGSDGSDSVAVGNPEFDETTLFFLGESDTLSGHAFDDFLHRKSSYLGFAADFTTQWNKDNTLKVGADFQRHTLRYYRHLFPTNVYNPDVAYDDVVNYGFDQFGNETDAETLDGFEDGPKKPVTFSLYAQNKYEYNDFVLNAGLRFDYLDPNTPALRDADNPFGADESSLDAADLVDSNTQNKVSPRLGFAFPISERTLFHANYGKFFQQPNLEDLYVSYRYLEYKIIKSGYYFAFGNPNLDSQKTTAYEVGVTRALNDDVVLDVTGYYKDVEDLVQVVTIPAAPSAFASFRNSDFATIKGIDLSLNMRERNGISGSINYGLAFARGTGSTSQTQRIGAWTNDEVPKQTAPLAFDQRHKLTMNVDMRGGENAGPMIGGFHPLEHSGVNVVFRASSGFPETPIFVANEITLGASFEEPRGAVNSVYAPWTVQTDLKATRDFMVGGLDLQAYVWVLNVLDRRNAVTIYRSTGSAETTGWLTTQEGQEFAQEYGEEGVELYQFAERDPSNFGTPRTVRFGLKMGF